MLKILDWLELHPGKTWQERWNSSGAGTDGTADWRDQAVAELEAAGKLGHRGRGAASRPRHGHGPADRRRRAAPGPALAAGHHLPVPGRRGNGPDPRPRRDRRPEKAAGGRHYRQGHVRPGGRAGRPDHGRQGRPGRRHHPRRLHRAAGLLPALFAHGTRVGRHSPFFYQLLHMAGIFPPGAAAHGPDDQPQVRRAAQRRAAGRPLRPGLPPGPRPAGGLPARTPARHRLQHPRQAGQRPWACASGRTSRPTTPASAPCTCRPASPPGGRSASRPGPSARPAAASRSSSASRPTTS